MLRDLLVGASLALVTLSGCGDTSAPTRPAGDDGGQPAAAGVCEPDGQSMVVDASCFDEPWPLTVPSGTLRCDAEAVYFDTGGSTYAVNGMATTRGAPEIDPIWRDNPDLAGIKISVGPLIDTGLDLC